MTQDQLEMGEIYVDVFKTDNPNQTTRGVIFRFDNPIGKSNPHINAIGNYYVQRHSSPDSSFLIPTDEERQWLLACIEENRTMTLQEALNKYSSYQIF